MAVTTDPLTGVFDADRTHSSFQFAVRHMKVSTFRASFGDLDARLIADASGLRLAGAARVESISIADPPQFREHVVRGADFFDADNHPEILFRSQRVELAENGTATVDGELTIRASAGRSRRRGRTSGRSRIRTAPCARGSSFEQSSTGATGG
ncbi:MAG: YceI family protein [Solirubrobacteraceae bacterium]